MPYEARRKRSAGSTGKQLRHALDEETRRGTDDITVEASKAAGKKAARKSKKP
ncbi:MAG: hypothetical protein R3F10_05805 [Lysobacteraceae bacterium]